MAKKKDANSYNNGTIDQLTGVQSANINADSYGEDFGSQVSDLFNKRAALEAQDVSRQEAAMADQGSYIGDLVEESTYGKGLSDADLMYFNPADRTHEDDLDERIAEKQTFASRLGSSLVNNVTIAGTTAVDGTIGLLYGIGSAIYNQDFNKIWNNEVSNSMASIRDLAGENFFVSRGREYEESGLWGKVFSGIFLADLIQNAGYTEGMLLPGMGASTLFGKVGAGLARVAQGIGRGGKIAQGLAKGANWTFGTAVPHVLSASSEAAGEAMNHYREEQEKYLKLATEAYNKSRQELLANPEMGIADREKKLKDLENTYLQTLSDQDKDLKAQANMVWGLNMGILTLSNALGPFEDMITGGFVKTVKGALRSPLKFNSNRISNAIEKKLGRKGLEAAIKAKSKIVEGAKAGGLRLFKSSFEGMEEVAQDWASSVVGAYRPYNNFKYSALYDNNQETVEERRKQMDGFFDASLSTIKELVHDESTQIDFISGLATGIMGTVVPHKKDGKWTLLSGSIFHDIRDAISEAGRQNEFREKLIARLEKNPYQAFYEAVMRKGIFENEKTAAAANGSHVDFQNSADASLINDIFAFTETKNSKLFRSLVDAYKNMSDEQLQQLIDDSCKPDENGNVSSVFMKPDGNKMTVQEARGVMEKNWSKLDNMLSEYEYQLEQIEKLCPTLDGEAYKRAMYDRMQVYSTGTRINSMVGEVLDAAEAAQLDLKAVSGVINANPKTDDKGNPDLTDYEKLASAFEAAGDKDAAQKVRDIGVLRDANSKYMSDFEQVISDPALANAMAAQDQYRSGIREQELLEERDNNQQWSRIEGFVNKLKDGTASAAELLAVPGLLGNLTKANLKKFKGLVGEKLIERKAELVQRVASGNFAEGWVNPKTEEEKAFINYLHQALEEFLANNPISAITQANINKILNDAFVKAGSGAKFKIDGDTAEAYMRVIKNRLDMYLNENNEFNRAFKKLKNRYEEWRGAHAAKNPINVQDFYYTENAPYAPIQGARGAYRFSVKRGVVVDEQGREVPPEIVEALGFDVERYRLETEESKREHAQDIEAELKVLRRMFPQLTERSRLFIVKSLGACANGQAIYGKFAEGCIYLAEEAKAGTLYHEAFHAVLKTMFSGSSRDQLFGAAKEVFGSDLKPYELEERMAEEFREYVQHREELRGNGGTWHRLCQFFIDIWETVQYFARPNGRRAIDQMYKRMYEGKYARKTLNDSRTAAREAADAQTMRVTLPTNMGNMYTFVRKPGADYITMVIQQDTKNKNGDVIWKHYDIPLNGGSVQRAVYNGIMRYGINQDRGLMKAFSIDASSGKLVWSPDSKKQRKSKDHYHNNRTFNDALLTFLAEDPDFSGPINMFLEARKAEGLMIADWKNLEYNLAESVDKNSYTGATGDFAIGDSVLRIDSEGNVYSLVDSSEKQVTDDGAVKLLRAYVNSRRAAIDYLGGYSCKFAEYEIDGTEYNGCVIISPEGKVSYLYNYRSKEELEHEVKAYIEEKERNKTDNSTETEDDTDNSDQSTGEVEEAGGGGGDDDDQSTGGSITQEQNNEEATAPEVTNPSAESEEKIRPAESEADSEQQTQGDGYGERPNPEGFLPSDQTVSNESTPHVTENGDLSDMENLQKQAQHLSEATGEDPVIPAATVAKSTQEEQLQALFDDQDKVQSEGTVDENGVSHNDVSVYTIDNEEYARVHTAIGSHSKMSKGMAIGVTVGSIIDEYTRRFFVEDESRKNLFDNIENIFKNSSSDEIRGIMTALGLNGLSVVKKDVLIAQIEKALTDFKARIEAEGGQVIVASSKGQDLVVSYDFGDQIGEELQHLYGDNKDLAANLRGGRVAGTLDILVKNADGTFDIYDLKSSANFDECCPSGKHSDLFEAYRKQLALYKSIMEHKYGMVIRQCRILPISVGRVEVGVSHTVRLVGAGEYTGSNKDIQSPIDTNIPNFPFPFKDNRTAQASSHESVGQTQSTPTSAAPATASTVSEQTNTSSANSQTVEEDTSSQTQTPETAPSASKAQSKAKSMQEILEEERKAEEERIKAEEELLKAEEERREQERIAAEEAAKAAAEEAEKRRKEIEKRNKEKEKEVAAEYARRRQEKESKIAEEKAAKKAEQARRSQEELDALGEQYKAALDVLDDAIDAASPRQAIEITKARKKLSVAFEKAQADVSNSIADGKSKAANAAIKKASKLISDTAQRESWDSKSRLTKDRKSAVDKWERYEAAIDSMTFDNEPSDSEMGLESDNSGSSEIANGLTAAKRAIKSEFYSKLLESPSEAERFIDEKLKELIDKGIDIPEVQNADPTLPLVFDRKQAAATEVEPEGKVIRQYPPDRMAVPQYRSAVTVGSPSYRAEVDRNSDSYSESAEEAFWESIQAVQADKIESLPSTNEQEMEDAMNGAATAPGGTPVQEEDESINKMMQSLDEADNTFKVSPVEVMRSRVDDESYRTYYDDNFAGKSDQELADSGLPNAIGYKRVYETLYGRFDASGAGTNLGSGRVLCENAFEFTPNGGMVNHMKGGLPLRVGFKRDCTYNVQENEKKIDPTTGKEVIVKTEMSQRYTMFLFAPTSSDPRTCDWRIVGTVRGVKENEFLRKLNDKMASQASFSEGKDFWISDITLHCKTYGNGSFRESHSQSINAANLAERWGNGFISEGNGIALMEIDTGDGQKKTVRALQKSVLEYNPRQGFDALQEQVSRPINEALEILRRGGVEASKEAQDVLRPMFQKLLQAVYVDAQGNEARANVTVDIYQSKTRGSYIFKLRLISKNSPAAGGAQSLFPDRDNVLLTASQISSPDAAKLLFNSLLNKLQQTAPNFRHGVKDIKFKFDKNEARDEAVNKVNIEMAKAAVSSTETVNAYAEVSFDKQAIDGGETTLSSTDELKREVEAKKASEPELTEDEERRLDAIDDISGFSSDDGGALFMLADGPYEKGDLDGELRYLAKIFPQLSTEDRLKVVKGLIPVVERGAYAWGQYRNGIITLSDIGTKGVAYHEAFHAAFHLLATDLERRRMLAEARRKHDKEGRLEDWELEECLAEDFREYMLTRDERGLGKRIRRFFKNLLFKVLHANDTQYGLEDYFRDMADAKWVNRVPNDRSGGVKPLPQDGARYHNLTPRQKHVIDVAYGGADAWDALPLGFRIANTIC